jgi:pyruvate,water dikinase
MSGATVLWLDELDKPGAAEAAGNKMARLGELARAGMAVPPGFVITADAYRSFVASAGLDAVIDRHLGPLRPGAQPAAVEAASKAVREAVDAAAVAEELADAVGDAYEELAYRCRTLRLPVAVRSSATGEDAGDASCAGQFESYLGVVGADGVVAAVRRCWASLFTPRAILYRLGRGLSLHDFPMAVGVLRLLDARSSGVGFSIDPVTGKTDRVVVEASWGFGEALVQGAVTPDRIEIDKEDRRILRRRVADKAVVSTFDHRLGRVVEGDMPARFRQAPVLDDEEALAVASAVVAIEEHYGHAADVEWVIEHGRRPGQPVTIVQARPETTCSVSGSVPETASPVWDPAAYAAKYAYGPKR